MYGKRALTFNSRPLGAMVSAPDFYSRGSIRRLQVRVLQWVNSPILLQVFFFVLFASQTLAKQGRRSLFVGTNEPWKLAGPVTCEYIQCYPILRLIRHTGQELAS